MHPSGGMEEEIRRVCGGSPIGGTGDPDQPSFTRESSQVKCPVKCKVNRMTGLVLTDKPRCWKGSDRRVMSPYRVSQVRHIRRLTRRYGLRTPIYVVCRT